MTPRRVLLLLNASSAVILLAVASSCGGGDSTNPGQTPTALIRVSGNSQSGTVGEVLANALVVKVVDAAGYGVPNVAVHWSVSSGGGSLNANSTVTDQTGQTLVTLTLGSAPGPNTVSASAAQLTPVVFTATAIGTPAQLSYSVQPTSVTAGAPIVQAVQVVVQDAVGNTVPNATNSVTLAITVGTGASGATLGGTLSQTAAGGVATFDNLTIDKSGSGYTLTATAPGLVSAVSTAFNVDVGPAAKLAIVAQPSDVSAGAAISPAVQVVVQDAQGNAVTIATNSVTLAITSGSGTPGATLGGTLTKTPVSGVAAFNNLTVDKSGSSYRLTATATGLTSVTTTPFDVNAGPATRMVFSVQPSDVMAGVTIAPAVQVVIQDAQGNLVITATDTIYVRFTVSYGATLSGTVKHVAVGGVATFNDLAIDKAHTGYQLFAISMDRDLGQVNSTSFAVNVGPPDRLTFLVQPRDMMAEVVFDSALQVVIQDNQGNRVTSSTASVTVAITSGTGAVGATLSGTPTRSADTGVATFGDLSIDSAGTGYTLTATSTGLTSDTTAAFRVIGPLFATLVSAAQYVFNCALVSGGAAYCWGYNGNGQLGNGSTTGTNAPVAVSGGLTFASLSSGGLHSCGVTSAGLAHCWGNGAYGQLGNGSLAENHTPVLVTDTLTFDFVSAGVYHTCGVTTTGAAYCWGDGGNVLGDSSGGTSTTPRRVAGGHVFASVSAGYIHSCGVRTDGAAYCWGDGQYGDLGNGSVSAANAPVPVSGGLTFAAVSAGDAPNSCGLTTGGAAYCWGQNQYGQLGDGSANPLSTTPVPVSGGLTFTAISAGSYHNCGLTAGGAMYCWGLNRFGQLGDGTTIDRNTPVLVSGGVTFTSVSAGRDHTCGLSSASIVYCWGYNLSGELGDRTTINRSVPVRVSGP